MTLFLKLFLAPLLLGIASLASRVFGNTISGALVALPIIAGPIIFILTYEQGLEFGAAASKGALLGIIQFAAFCLSYTFFSGRLNALYTLLLSFGVDLIVIYFLQFIHLSPITTFIIVIIILGITFRLLPNNDEDYRESKPPYWEILIRMLAAAVLVLLVTSIANHVGPTLSGLLASFPIAFSILTFFSHYLHGHESVIRMARGFIIGLFGFASFFLILAIGLPLAGLKWTFPIAIFMVTSFHFISILISNK